MLLRYWKVFVFTMICVFLSNYSFAQMGKDAKKLFDMGIENQLYPAGDIVYIRTMRPINKRSGLMLKLGYDFARRQNFGKHDKENGGGPGFALGYRYYIKKELEGFFLAARAGLWVMKIDWEDNRNSIIASGKTNITVLQPTAAAGYQYVTQSGHWAFEAGAAFGIEWNIATKGEEVGQGGISLFFVGVSRRF